MDDFARCRCGRVYFAATDKVSCDICGKGWSDPNGGPPRKCGRCTCEEQTLLAAKERHRRNDPSLDLTPTKIVTFSVSGEQEQLKREFDEQERERVMRTQG